MKYKAVIFDLFGTLVNILPLREYENSLTQMASTLLVSPDDFIRSWKTTFNQRMTGHFPNCEANIKYICRELGVPINDNQIERAAQIRFDYTRREVMSLQSGAVDILSLLKTSGYKTGLISDCSIATIILLRNPCRKINLKEKTEGNTTG